MNIKTIGIIGAGTMGQGVAHQFAKYNYKVILIDLNETILNQAKQVIKNTMRLDHLLSEAPSPTVGNLLDYIHYSTDLNELKDCEFIIENIIENTDAKFKLYDQLKTIAKSDAIVAVNTSCISITKIGSLMPDASLILGIHFMNPVHLKPTVEMIEGVYTSKETIDGAQHLLGLVQMEGIVVKDSPGFVSNRISHLLMNEAAFIVQEQVATPTQVDDIFKKCFGHKMGPLETADLIGIDTVVDSLQVLFDATQDSKFRCCTLLRKKADAGQLGRKSGEGFHKY